MQTGFESMQLSTILALAIPWAFKLSLAIVRAGAMLAALPGWQHRGIPAVAKGGLVVGLCSTIALTSPPAAVEPTFGMGLAVLMAMEFVFGFTVGFLFSLPIQTAKFAGQIMGIEMGLSFSAVSDPLTQSSATVMSAIIGAAAVQLCFALGLDREFVGAIALSAQYRPLGTTTFEISIFKDLLEMGTQIYIFALKLALPALGTLFTLKLSMAYLARLAPKLQIFSLTFILTLIVGQWVIVQSLPSVGAALAEELRHAMTLVWSVVKMVPHGPR